MQEVTNLQDSDIQVPYWLSIYHSGYGRAAMALNWRVLWLGEGAITGIVVEVSKILPEHFRQAHASHMCLTACEPKHAATNQGALISIAEQLRKLQRQLLHSARIRIPVGLCCQ